MAEYSDRSARRGSTRRGWNDGLERLGGFREFVCIGVFSDTLLRRVLLPVTLKVLGDYAFYGCRELASVTFAEGSRLEEVGRRCFAESRIVSVVLPMTLRWIRDSAFCDCRSLKTIYVEDGCKADFSGIWIPASVHVVLLQGTLGEDGRM